jgi:hypothetical protein
MPGEQNQDTELRKSFSLASPIRLPIRDNSKRMADDTYEDSRDIGQFRSQPVGWATPIPSMSRPHYSAPLASVGTSGFSIFESEFPSPANHTNPFDLSSPTTDSSSTAATFGTISPSSSPVLNIYGPYKKYAKTQSSNMAVMGERVHACATRFSALEDRMFKGDLPANDLSSYSHQET